MIKILKASFRDTVIYGIGTFATKLSGFILVPLYTSPSYLSEQQYGVLNVAEASIQIIISVFGLGLSYGYERWYYDKEQIARRKSIFFSILLATAAIALTLVVLGAVFAAQLSQVLFDVAQYETIVKLMLLVGGLEMVSQTPNSLMRMDERPGLFTTVNLLKLVTSVLATVVLIVVFDQGLEGVYYGQLLGLSIYFACLAPYLFKRMAFTFERDALLDIVRFRFPFLMPVIALNLLNFSDRFVFVKSVGLAEAGIYSLGVKLSNTIKVFLITAIWMAITPTIYKMMNEPGNKRFYSKLMTYLSFGVLMAVMAFSFFSREVVGLVASDETYLQAARVIPILSLAIFFAMLKDTSLIGLNISKKTGAIAVITIALSILNLGLNIALIPRLGMIGAASATLFSQILFFVFVYRVAQKHYPIPYELPKILLMLATAIALFIFAELLNVLNAFWMVIVLKLLLLALFPFVLYLLQFYEPIEISRIIGFWRKWRNPRRWKTNFQSLEL